MKLLNLVILVFSLMVEITVSQICYNPCISGIGAGQQVCYGWKVYSCVVPGWCNQLSYNPGYMYVFSAWSLTGQTCPLNCRNQALPVYVNGGQVNLAAYNFTTYYTSTLGVNATNQCDDTNGNGNSSSQSGNTQTIQPTPQPTPQPAPQPTPQPTPLPVPQPAPQPPADNSQVCTGFSNVPNYDSSVVYSTGNTSVIYQGNLYQNSWWTQGEQPGSAGVWKLICKYLPYTANITLIVSGSGITPSTTFSIQVNGQSQTIVVNQTQGIQVPSPQFTIGFTKQIIGNQQYVPAQTTYVNSNLTGYTFTVQMNYTAENIVYISYTVIINTLGSLSGVLTVVYPTESRLNTSQTVVSGSNLVQVVQGLGFIISLDNVIIPGTKTQYKATSTIDQTKSQQPAGFVFTIFTVIIPLLNNFTGYFYYWGNNPAATIGAAANLGYTDIILAFATVSPTDVYFESPFSSYSQYVNGVNIWEQNMINDILAAKASGKLQRLLISVGGENNTFQPGNGDPVYLAGRFYLLMKKFIADGIDFDIENLGVTDINGYADFTRKFIIALQALCNNKAIISIAPQINFTGSQCDLVNTGIQTFYYLILDLVNYIFYQEYNTASYSVDDKGQCTFGTAGVTEMYVQFMRNIMPRLVQIVIQKQYEAAYGKPYNNTSDTMQDTANKQISLLKSQQVIHVIGQPSDRSAAGQGQIFNGPDQAHLFNDFCNTLKATQNDFYMLNIYAGVWSINQAFASGNLMVAAGTALDCSTIANQVLLFITFILVLNLTFYDLYFYLFQHRNKKYLNQHQLQFAYCPMRACVLSEEILYKVNGLNLLYCDLLYEIDILVCQFEVANFILYFPQYLQIWSRLLNFLINPIHEETYLGLNFIFPVNTLNSFYFKMIFYVFESLVIQVGFCKLLLQLDLTYNISYQTRLSYIKQVSASSQQIKPLLPITSFFCLASFSFSIIRIDFRGLLQMKNFFLRTFLLLLSRGPLFNCRKLSPASGYKCLPIQFQLFDFQVIDVF